MNKGKQVPVITVALIIINVIVFVCLEAAGSTEDSFYMLQNGAASGQLIFLEKQYYRVFTSMFLHFGFYHLLNNMFMLAVIGASLENTIGRFSFLITYLISGVAGNVCSAAYYLSIGDTVISAGASGAIFGLLGALMVVIIKDRKGEGKGVAVRMLVLAVLLIFGNISMEGIDYIAHAGGLVAGVLLGLLLYRPAAKKG